MTKLNVLYVSDFHADIGIHCDNYLGSQKSSNWKGITFKNGKAKIREPIENKINRLYSLSSLQHVEIFHAGRDSYGNAVPALDVVGQPPVMSELSVKYSAFDAISIYKPDDSFALEKSVVSDNRGTEAIYCPLLIFNAKYCIAFYWLP